jgi:hypothetical protein
VVLIALSARASQDERVAAAFQSAEAFQGERLQKATRGRALVVCSGDSLNILGVVVKEVR